MFCTTIGVLTGCTPAYNPIGYPSYTGAANPGTGAARPSSALLTPDQTVDLENSDRIARFRRLANVSGVIPPAITQTTVTPEQVPDIARPIPVVRIVFDERVLFDFDQDVPRPEAAGVLDLVADNMRRDVPDAQMTLLGHTDAIGSDQFNEDLSMRRARNVFQALVNRGVNPAQLSTVAIGKNQPIASNETEEGRARNRRVEFLISASQDANLGTAACPGGRYTTTKDGVTIRTVDDGIHFSPEGGVVLAPYVMPQIVAAGRAQAMASGV